MTSRALVLPGRTLWLVLAACLIMLGFAALPAQAEETPGTLQGAVMRTPGGALAEAIPNARIDIHPLGDESVWYQPVTDENGHYRVELPDGTYQVNGIWVMGDNRWYPQWKQFNIRNGLLVESNQLWYELPYPVTGNVQGMITTEQGQFASNQTAWIEDITNNQWIHTDTNILGQFGLNLPDGNYRLAKISGHYLDRFFTVTNGYSDVASLDVQMPGKSLQGRLLDGTEPVANQSLPVYRDVNGHRMWYTLTTDQDGYFSAHLQDGVYELNGYWNAAANQTQPVRRTIEIAYGSTDPNPYLIDLNAVPVTGRVIYEGNAAPPANKVQIHVHSADYSRWYSDFTDAAGHFTVHLPDGEYQVDTVWYENGSRNVYKSFTVKDGQLVGDLVVEIPVLPEGNVQGLITDASGALMRKSRVMIEVRASGTYTWAFTNASGQFGLNLPDGDYRLSDVNDYRVDRFFTVQDGQLQGADSLHVHLPSLSLEGRLLDNGTPMANTHFDISKEINGVNYWYSLDTDANGNFSRHLEDGVYHLGHMYVPAHDQWIWVGHSIVVSNGNTTPDTYLLDISPQ